MLSRSKIAPVSNVTRITNFIMRIISPTFSGDFEIQTALAARHQAKKIIRQELRIFERLIFLEANDMEWIIALVVIVAVISELIGKDNDTGGDTADNDDDNDNDSGDGGGDGGGD